jgi:hypothetical protein
LYKTDPIIQAVLPNGRAGINNKCWFLSGTFEFPRRVRFSGQPLEVSIFIGTFFFKEWAFLFHPVFSQSTKIFLIFLKMQPAILLKTENYSIIKYNGIPEEAIKFLKSIAWGSEGTLYEHKNTEEHIRSLEDPMLFALWKDDRIQATTVLSNRKISVNEKQFKSYYFRYFAIAPELRGSGIMPRYSQQLLKGLLDEQEEKTIFYSHVEKNNRPSFRVTEMAGLKNSASFKTTGFSRFFPKWDNRIEKITADADKNEVLALLKDFYRKHSFVQFHSVFQNDNYYVIRENDRIIAGCQYHRVHWKIKAMPGMKGKIIMNIVPWIPLINKLFNPKWFEFLALEAIYFKKGHEDELKKLFEGLLAKEKLHSAMFWMGSTCPYREIITKKGRLGLFNSFIKNSEGSVMVATKYLTEEDILLVRTVPVYVSAFDNF